MGYEEDPLVPTEISSLEYESETESDTESVLSAYQSPLPTPLPLTPPSLTPSPPSYTAMSQHNYPTIIRQLQEQLVA